MNLKTLEQEIAIAKERLGRLEKQKELYLNIIGNIENIISNFDKIEDKDTPYSNHLLLQTFNIMDFIGKPNDIHDYCLSFKGEDYFDE